MKRVTFICLTACLVISNTANSATARGFGGGHAGGFGGGAGGGFGGAGGGLGGAGGFHGASGFGGAGAGFGGAGDANRFGNGFGGGGFGPGNVAGRGGSGLPYATQNVNGLATPRLSPEGFGGFPSSSSELNQVRPQGFGPRGFGSLGFGGNGLGNGLERDSSLGQFDRSKFNAAAPSASKLSSFLGLPAYGLPSDSGYWAAGGHDQGMRYSGSARGLDAAAGGEAGYHGGVYHGPDGATIAHGAAGERGVAVGPDGIAAGGKAASGTVVKGPDGNVYARGEAGERGVVAGPDGVAGGSRAVGGAAVRTADGGVYAHGGSVTRHWSAADMHVQGNYVRTNFNHYDAFGRGWYARYPGAWWARGYAAGVWSAATWPTINTWFGVDWPAYGYSYGNDLTYVDDSVCLYGQPIATAADYYQSAADLAQTGEQADIPSEQPPAADDQQAAPTDQADAQWLPLGVFEALQPDQKSSKMTFQIAVNKAGIVRGNYFNSGDNNVKPIEGAVDKQTQRITWVVKDKANIIFDTGLYNLTKDEATVLVHFSKDKTQQWTLVRLKQPAGESTSQ